MAKKVIISEAMFNKILANQLLEEADLSKEDVKSIVKDSFKNDKDVEKRIRELVAKTVNLLFRTLWQRRNFYEDEIKKGSF